MCRRALHAHALPVRFQIVYGTKTCAKTLNSFWDLFWVCCSLRRAESRFFESSGETHKFGPGSSMPSMMLRLVGGRNTVLRTVFKSEIDRGRQCAHQARVRTYYYRSCSCAVLGSQFVLRPGTCGVFISSVRTNQNSLCTGSEYTLVFESM